MSDLSRVVVVGASLAGLRTAQALRQLGYRGALTIVGDEPHRPYNRPPLSKHLLTGHMSAADLSLPGTGPEVDVEWCLGVRATALDVRHRRVLVDRREALGFDAAVLATGAAARVPDIPGIDGPGVHRLRTLDDAIGLRTALEAGRRVVVVGAGFIGCEVAASARSMGKDVVLVEAAGSPMSRVLSPSMGEVFLAMHRDAGVDVRMRRTVQAFEHKAGVTHVRLDDGSVLVADLAVVGLGSVPNTGWLFGSGVRCDNGVLCDPTCRVMGTGGAVVAAGDVVNWPHLGLCGQRLRVEHWHQAVEQAQVAARALMEPDYACPYTPVLSLWSDQYGKKLQVLGAPWLADRTSVVEGSLAARRFTATCWKGDVLVGAIVLAMPAKVPALRLQLEDAMAVALHANRHTATAEPL